MGKTQKPRPSRGLNARRGRPPKDPVLYRLWVTGDYESELKTQGMPAELSSCAEVNEHDLPVDASTNNSMSLEQYAGGLVFGIKGKDGIHRKVEGGGAVAHLSYLEPEASERRKRDAAFMQMVTRILLVNLRKKSKEQTRELRGQVKLLREVREDLPKFPPYAHLPHFPDELGTPDQFLERWKQGELDVIFRVNSRRSQEIIIASTGLREYLDNLPEDPDDSLPDDGGHWDGLTWHPDIGC
jgi:hypothetical protein